MTMVDAKSADETCRLLTWLSSTFLDEFIIHDTASRSVGGVDRGLSLSFRKYIGQIQIPKVVENTMLTLNKTAIIYFLLLTDPAAREINVLNNYSALLVQ